MANEKKELKTVLVDGQKYILQSDVDEYFVEKGKTFNLLTPAAVDMEPANVMGIGSVKLGNQWCAVKVGPELLQKALRTQKILLQKDCVTLVFTTDMPLIVGTLDKEKGEASGIIIAPRVEV